MVVSVLWVWSKRKADLRSVCVFCYLWRFDGLDLQWMSEPTQWMSIYVIMNVIFLCVVYVMNYLAEKRRTVLY